MQLMGLPPESAQAFLFGFFRRDYGAAGLFDLQQGGAMTGNQLAVAAITLTLFLPCIAQFLILKKERGTRTALATSAGILVLAFAAGLLVHQVLNLTGASL
jgi:ferrous iron transport protein B